MSAILRLAKRHILTFALQKYNFFLIYANFFAHIKKSSTLVLQKTKKITIYYENTCVYQKKIVPLRENSQYNVIL